MSKCIVFRDKGTASHITCSVEQRGHRPTFIVYDSTEREMQSTTDLEQILSIMYLLISDKDLEVL